MKAEHIVPIRRALGGFPRYQSASGQYVGIWTSTLGFLIADYIAGDKNLSRDQEELSALKLGRFPRVVRGVAGSGKTVVLANQVARYALRNGDLFKQGNSTIVALCFNRALVPFLRDKIRTSYVARSVDREPPDQVRVNHLNGLMYYIARALGVYPIEYIPIMGSKWSH